MVGSLLMPAEIRTCRSESSFRPATYQFAIHAAKVSYRRFGPRPVGRLWAETGHVPSPAFQALMRRELRFPRPFA